MVHPSRTTHVVHPGDVLAGKYRVERVLGVGGMGVVVAATHLALGQLVALKFMHAERMADQEAADRFLREARAASRLRSEHVAAVKDVGTLESGAPYICMEYLEGLDLGAKLDEHGPLAIVDAVDYLLQTCLALAEAHAQGIVHRDLKPTNLFVTRRPDGRPLLKVLDFGISKITSSTDARMTSTKAVMGTPFYMSPEQVRSSRRVDARSDVWSLGVVLYELVTHRVPFSGESFGDICVRIANDPPPPLDLPPPDAPPSVEDVVLKCLHKDPAERYQNVAELAQALAPLGPEGSFATARSVALTLGVPPAPANQEGVSGSQPQSLAPSTAPAMARPPRRLLLVAGAILGVGLAIGLGALLTGRASTPTPAPAPAVGDAAPKPAPAAPVVVPLASQPAAAATPDAGMSAVPVPKTRKPVLRPGQSKPLPRSPDKPTTPRGGDEDEMDIRN